MLWVELPVPGREQSAAHIEPFPVQAQLKHLRRAVQCPSLDLGHFWLLLENSDMHDWSWPARILVLQKGMLNGHITYLQFCILSHLNRTISANAASQKYLASEMGIEGVTNVILTHISMEEITEVKETIIQGNQDICYHSCNRQKETLHSLLSI